MKASIKIPSGLNEITLGQYQQFKRTADKLDESNEFLLQKMLECFCNIELKHVLLIQRKDVLSISSEINSYFTGKYDLIPRFKIKDIELGFIPNLEKITQGEYSDLNTYITDWQQMHKAIAVLFRPIKESKKGKYSIIDYQGTDEFAELMKFTPLDVALGAYVFFCHLGSELLNSTLNFLKEEATGAVSQWAHNSRQNGDGIIQSINLLTEKYSTLIESHANPFTNALPSSPINLKKIKLNSKNLIKA
tara:strand:- start:1120 stop:1863 length:744 start_codon:yes stop_codon:yes gene_type:complete